MATITGDGGAVSIGGTNDVASITNFTLNIQSDTVDSTTMGVTARTFKATKTQWSGTVECYWDPDDTNGQVALAIGSTVSLELQPEGDATSGDVHYDGSAIVTGLDISVPQDGMVTASFSFQGTGTLTTTTEP